MMLAGGVLAYTVQTAGGVRVLDVRFAGTGGVAMSALLFIPPNATPKTPAPGVLAVHGYFNSRETQGDFAIEFARRGYVVLALDQTGHGYSDPPAFANGFGGPDGLRYLRSLDFVDQHNIGLEGHSMGGWTVVNAAAALPDGYRSVVLQGSSTGAPFAPEGTARFPRNLAVVFAKHDEFSTTMWGVPSGADVTQSRKLWKAFDTDRAVQAGKVYGEIADGTARILYTPPGTHPWNHISKTAIGDAVDWFQRTLAGGTPRPRDDQIWQWKEFGTALAFAGFVVLLLGVFDALAASSHYFSSLSAPPSVPLSERSGRWWATLLVGALLPAATFFPFAQIGTKLLPASALFPQAFTNEIVVWALLNALLIFLLSLVPGGARPAGDARWGRSVLLALMTFIIGYATVAAFYAVFKVDLRYWFMALKPMSPAQLPIFLAYLVPFAVFFLLVLRNLHAALGVRSHSAGVQYLVNVVALVGGFLILLSFQYGALFTRGYLPTLFMTDTLRTIVAINFIPVMTVVAIVATFTFRRTGSYVSGALISGALVSWYIVVGQATQG
jgi:pimeloyl-ACP methyl ester carboxylesterase